MPQTGPVLLSKHTPQGHCSFASSQHYPLLASSFLPAQPPAEGPENHLMAGAQSRSSGDRPHVLRQHTLVFTVQVRLTREPRPGMGTGASAVLF